MPARPLHARWARLSLCVAVLCGCAGVQERSEPAADAQIARKAKGSCPPTAEAPALLPGTRPEHATLEYWLGRYPAAELDRVLLDEEGIANYVATVGRRPGQHPFAQVDLGVAADPVGLEHQVAERLAYLRERLDDGRYVTAEGEPLGEDARAVFDAPLGTLTPELRVALGPIQLRCGPYPEPLYKPDRDTRYDRNACSTVHPQEPVELLSQLPGGGMWLARTRYALGFVPTDAPLSPAVPRPLRDAYLTGAHVYTTAVVNVTDPAGEQHELPKHTALPRSSRAGRVHLATAAGFVQVPVPDAHRDGARPLTRRELLTTAFGFLDSPYGFGGKDAGRDCSRLQLDLFESFGVPLPRHSGWQAQAGSFRVDLSGKSEEEKLKLIRAAAQRGAMMLHLPGHVMLYLGEDDAGRPMALHALGEYAEPCADGPGETVVSVQRTVVSDLEVGHGSSRTSFLERLTGLAVIGDGPGDALAAVAKTPPAVPALPEPESCRDSIDRRIFSSPRRPWRGQPLRVIATSSADPGEAELWLWDPEGNPARGVHRHLDGPPYTSWTRTDDPAPGAWTAALARGGEVLACKRIHVRPNRPDPEPPAPGDDPVWRPRWSWERDTHNLWAAFVEQLFDYPADDGRTWQSLHALLRDPDRNLLYDHLSMSEEQGLELVPDCADLPYSLRAYFAWKLSLPFAYRQCSRGRSGVPPSCGPLRSNLMPREVNDPVGAFALFTRRRVGSGVHSASARTVPNDDATDLYPVALERASLPPGTVYADPYGHTMILTRWYAQGETGPYGVLMAAEAQPDGTVGRRRFWEGSFLFDPATDEVGAGFKQFRPLTYDAVAGALVSLDNAELAKSDQHVPHSLAQYQGTKADFYERMDALINPKPLDAGARMVSLVDALDESARRRVIAIDNGEQFMRERGFAPIEMPKGHAIFETAGPWEDYSTPSRDMRLLISIDTVLALPGRVAKLPARFGLSEAESAARAEKLKSELRAELERRSIVYVKSDGTPQRLTLADLVDRTEALEAAYNPNDCIEVRWGAPEGSDELSSCQRRAPRAQRELAERYRTWFSERARPARGE